MRAAVLTEHEEPLELREVDTPEPGDDEVLIQTEACGICRSDWHSWKGEMPLGRILGHEPVGTIVEAGDAVEKFAIGDRVVLPFNIVCGRCVNCRSGDSHMCENLELLGYTESLSGAYASHLRVPRADFNCALVPDGFSATDAAALGCRFVTAYHGMTSQVTLNPRKWVAVHGCGGVGLSAVDIASAFGARVIAIDLFDEKLEMAEGFGATEVINAREVDDVSQAIDEIVPGGVDISIDALGIENTVQNSLQSVRAMGTHLQIGQTSDEEDGTVEIPLNHMLYSEISFENTTGFPPHRYPEIFELMEQGLVSPQDLVTKVVSLDDVSDRLEAMSNFETRGVEVIGAFE